MQDRVNVENVIRITATVWARYRAGQLCHPASVLSRNDDGAGSRHDDQGLFEHPRGRLPTLGLRAADNPCLKGQLAAAAAHTGQDRRCFYDVSSKYRGQELDLGVGGEEGLVGVGADGQLGGDVAEQGEDVGAVDEVAAVVGVAGRDVA